MYVHKDKEKLDFFAVWLTPPYHDFIGGFGQCWQHYDGLSRDGSSLSGAVTFPLYPATPLKGLIILNNDNEISFLEAEEVRVI